MTIKNERITTPKGYADYPYLSTPDTKFDADGVYKVNLICEDNEATNKLIQKLEAIRDAFYEKSEDVAKALKSRKTVTKADVCEFDEEGNVVFKFKQRAKIKCKDGSMLDVKIAHFDSKGKPIKCNVGRDSVIRVSFTVNPYFTPSTKIVGVSLRPVAVQVIDLKEFGGNSAEDYGFEEEEGYEGTPEEDPPFDTMKDDGEEPLNRGDF